MSARRRRLPGAARARGAALIILMALLALGVLYFVTSQLEAISLYQRESQQGEATDSLAQAREALIGYATTYRDDAAHSTEVFGYLPCPDIDGDGIAEASCGNAGEASVGLLPYRTLGLPDLRDNSGACLWYAVSGSFKNNPKAGATLMNWDTQGQFRVLDSSGASLIAPDDSQGGAAAVIFAAGPPLAGQSRGTSGAGPCAANPAEVAAYLDGGYTFATGATVSLNQGVVKDGNGTVTNNDRLAWVTPRQIFDRVVKRQDFSNALAASPPGQVNTLIDRLAKALETRLQNDIFNATSTSLPLNTASYSPQPASAAMGDVDPNTDISLTNAVSYANYLTNWSDQFRLIRCTDLGAACLDINNGSANCRGALVFSGRTGSGEPRTSAQKGSSIALLANYFDGASNTGARDLLTTGLGRFVGRTGYVPPVPLAGATWSGGTATVTTSSAHGFSTDFFVSLSGAFPGAYNGTYRITVLDATRFTFPLASNPGAYVSGGTVYSSNAAACLGFGTYVSLKGDAAQFASGTVTPGGGGSAVAAVTGAGTSTPAIVLGSATTNARAGCVWYPVPLQVASSLRLYFSYRIDSATTGSTARGYTLTLADAATNNPYLSDPLMCGASGTTRMGYAGTPAAGSATVNGSTVAITANSWLPSTQQARISTAVAHGYFVGDTVTIAGAAPSGYNGDYTIATVPSSTSFTYSVAYPGPARAGIADPKLAVEFDTNVDSSRNDPTAEHFAALYWGSLGDNNQEAGSTTRDGGDDNMHNNGVAGDGSQPLNPRSLSTTAATATAVAGITAARWSGGVVTVGTSAPHGIANGQRVVVTDTSPLGYKGTHIATVTDPAHFTYPLADSPGVYPFVATVAAATWSSGTATVTTAGDHGLSSGQSVTLSNLSPAAWNGTYVVTSIDGTHFSYTLATNPGAYVSGGQVSYPLNWVNTASWADGKVTMETAAQHKLASNQFVTISNVYPAGYNGTYRVTVIDANHFSYALAYPTVNPGPYVSGGLVAITGMTSTVMAAASTAIAAATWSTGGFAIIDTAVAHNLVSGQTVHINGVTSAGPASYNGVYMVTVVGASRFIFGHATDPGAYLAGGVAATAAPASATVNSAAWSPTGGGTVTVATAAAHGYASGQLVVIAGVAPAGYNGAYPVTVIDATHFSYPLASDPGGSFAAASFAVPGIATVKSSDIYLPYNGSMPTDTDIHVRIDLVRGYDAARHQATLTMKAYMGDTFALAGNCGLADFKNFARDLSETCPLRSPTIEQDGIIVNDVAGPAMRNVYLGFTTARGAAASDNQTINVSNLILRSQ